jgi:nucleoid-associated protein YgaU
MGDTAGSVPEPEVTTAPDESVPAPAPPGEPEPAPEPAARTYTVEAGDTLWTIAERFYGDGARYQAIADASGISNPDLVQAGQILTIP